MANRLCDKFGNILTCTRGQVWLRLNGSQRERFLGEVEGDTFRTFRKRAHRFECMDAIGFNWHLMKHGKFRTVEVELETGEVLCTTRGHVLEFGSVKMFKNQGFELQIFLPVSNFITEGALT